MILSALLIPKRQAICLVLAAAYGLMTLLAACPSLHRMVHGGAEHADHHCGVTEMVAGNLLVQPGSPVQVPVVVSTSWRIEPVEGKDSPPIALRGLPLERGPPACAVSTLL